MVNRIKCPHCGNLYVASTGPENASIMIVFDAPTYDDIRDGRICSGRAGDVLRAELARAGIQMATCRIVSLWKHGKNKECNYESHVSMLTEELDGHDWVFLTGTEAAKLLTGHSIMEITGLRAKSKLFPKIKFFGIPNPGSLLHGDVGEMRLALEKFTKIRSKTK